MIENWKKK